MHEAQILCPAATVATSLALNFCKSSNTMVRTARALRRVKNVYTVDRKKRRRLLEIQAASYDIGNWCPENARKSLVMVPRKEINKKIKKYVKELVQRPISYCTTCKVFWKGPDALANWKRCSQCGNSGDENLHRRYDRKMKETKAKRRLLFPHGNAPDFSMIGHDYKDYYGYLDKETQYEILEAGTEVSILTSSGKESPEFMDMGCSRFQCESQTTILEVSAQLTKALLDDMQIPRRCFRLLWGTLQDKKIFATAILTPVQPSDPRPMNLLANGTFGCESCGKPVPGSESCQNRCARCMPNVLCSRCSFWAEDPGLFCCARCISQSEAEMLKQNYPKELKRIKLIHPWSLRRGLVQILLSRRCSLHADVAFVLPSNYIGFGRRSCVIVSFFRCMPSQLHTY